MFDFVFFLLGMLAMVLAGKYTKFTDGAPIVQNEFSLLWQTYDGVSAYQDMLRFVRANPPRFGIPRAGDIDINDDRFMKIRRDSDGTLPTQDASYRGKMIRIEGEGGQADRLYMCMKGADDTYAWVQIA